MLCILIQEAVFLVGKQSYCSQQLPNRATAPSHVHMVEERFSSSLLGKIELGPGLQVGESGQGPSCLWESS